MKSTDNFKKVVKDHLDQLALNDKLFAETLKKETKNIDDCITYILNTVKASGNNGFADEEIFNMAIHYYDEDDVAVGSKISNTQVVVNHAVSTPKTKEVKKPIVKKEVVTDNQISMF